MPVSRADELGRDHRDALRLLGYVLLRQGQAIDAVAVFKGLLRLDPGDRQAHRALISAHLAADDPEHALEQASSYVVRPNEPRAAALHLLRAQALWRLGQRQEARESLDRFIELRGVD
jgi:tetratricopeptide (TPR) repeat protein